MSLWLTRETIASRRLTQRETLLLSGENFGRKDGQFSLPSAIAVDSQGNVFVVDRKNHRIQVFAQKLSPVSLIWQDFGQDKVGREGDPNPNGQGDGHSSVVLDIKGTKTVSVMTLMTTDERGNPAFGQVWNTAPDRFWILGVFRNGIRLNPTDTMLIPVYEPWFLATLIIGSSVIHNVSQYVKPIDLFKNLNKID